MTNALQVFNYGNDPVRTVEIDGEFWFVAKDVCEILEYTNVTKTLQKLSMIILMTMKRIP